MKNFFQNSPYEQDGAQKRLNDGLLFTSESNSLGKQTPDSSFAPIFSENFFNEGVNNLKGEKKPIKSIMQKRLNDFDGNILRESAILNFDDKDIRLEEKIKIAQELLKSYKEKISFMESYGNSPIKNKLVSQKEDLEGILDNLNKELRNTSFFGENISLKIDEEKRLLAKKIGSLKESCKKKVQSSNFLYRIFPRVYQIKILKDSLKKLRKVNNIVKDLAQSQTPYGEGDIKYQSLIAYLSFASSLHSKLKKRIGS